MIVMSPTSSDSTYRWQYWIPFGELTDAESVTGTFDEGDVGETSPIEMFVAKAANGKLMLATRAINKGRMEC